MFVFGKLKTSSSTVNCLADEDRNEIAKDDITKTNYDGYYFSQTEILCRKLQIEF